MADRDPELETSLPEILIGALVLCAVLGGAGLALAGLYNLLSNL